MTAEYIFRTVHADMEAVLRLLSPTAHIHDVSDDEFRLRLFKDALVWDITLAEQRVREPQGNGFCVALTSTGLDAEIGPSIIPQNYTSQLWTRSVEDLKERLLAITAGVQSWVADGHPPC